jgi:hypothetical protein
MNIYVVIQDNEDPIKVIAETEDDAISKTLYFRDKESTLEYIYCRIVGYWNSYFYKKDPNFYPIEEFEECFHSYEIAQKLLLLNMKNIPMLEKYKEIILDFLSGDKSEEWWIKNDPFPWELKKFICSFDYHGMMAHNMKDIKEIA